MKIYQLPLLALALFAGFNAKAQLRLSPEGGFNLCSIQEKAPDVRVNQFSRRIAYRIGIAADVQLARHFYIQPGLFYAKKGQAYFFQDLFNQHTFFKNIENVDYLEVPLRIEYKSNKPGADRFMLGIGAYAAYALSGRSSIGPEWGLPKVGTYTIGNSETDDIRPFDFGLSVNMGYEFASGLFIRSYYNYGITNLNSETSLRPRYTYETGVSTGYWLPIKHKPTAPSK